MTSEKHRGEQFLDLLDSVRWELKTKARDTFKRYKWRCPGLVMISELGYTNTDIKNQECYCNCINYCNNYFDIIKSNLEKYEQELEEDLYVGGKYASWIIPRNIHSASYKSKSGMIMDSVIFKMPEAQITKHCLSNEISPLFGDPGLSDEISALYEDMEDYLNDFGKLIEKQEQLR